MRIGFIGAGKAGFTLGKYFTEHGVHVSGYFSRNQKSADEASLFTHTESYTQLAELAEASDALFLTVPDGQIESVWNSIKRYDLSGKCICHCSGALSSAVFSEIDQMGAFGYSIHPLFAIHSKTESFRELSNSYFTIEGHEKYLKYWQETFESFGNHVKIIKSEQKVLYHAAAVFASNLVCGLFDEAVSIMEKCGFSPQDAAKAIGPLFLNNASSLVKNGAAGALTGPLERADVNTLRKHMEVLPEKELETYITMSSVLVDIAKKKNPQRDYKEVINLLHEKNERYGK